MAIKTFHQISHMFITIFVFNALTKSDSLECTYTVLLKLGFFFLSFFREGYFYLGNVHLCL